MFSIYVWPFGPFLWIISKNHTASSSRAKSLPFRFTHWGIISTGHVQDMRVMSHESGKPSPIYGV